LAGVNLPQKGKQPCWKSSKSKPNCPFGARLRRASKGRKGYQGRAERSHRTNDEEFYISCLRQMKTVAGFLRKAQRWQYYYDVERPHFGARMDGKAPVDELRGAGG